MVSINIFMVHNIFISYAVEDKTVADAICANLENEGLQFWIAPRNIAPGEKYAPAIIHAIDNSKFVVVVFSHNSDQSPNIRTEIERAFNQGKIIIPFRIENIEPSDEMQYFIGSRQWLDAFSGPLDEHTKRLVDIIKNHLNVKPESRETQKKTQSSQGNQFTTSSAGDFPRNVEHNKFFQIIYRSLSFIIDFGIGFVIGFFCWILYLVIATGVIGQENINRLNYVPNSTTQASPYAIWVMIMLVCSGVIFWFLIIEISQIRSPGKALLGLKIYWPPDKTNSEKWRTIRSLIKNGPILAMLLVGLFGFASDTAVVLGIILAVILWVVWFVPIIFTSKSQSIHDLITGTVVNAG